MWELLTEFVGTLSDFAIFVLIAMFIILHGKSLVNGIFGNKKPSEIGDYDNESLSQQMSQLQQYYNHDTTEILNNILENQEQNWKTMIKVEQTLREIKEYGVKIRDK